MSQNPGSGSKFNVFGSTTLVDTIREREHVNININVNINVNVNVNVNVPVNFNNNLSHVQFSRNFIKRI